jgi:hypothetical protein
MKVGKYTYPDWRLQPTLIETIKKIYGKFALKRIDDKDVLAKFLGHTGVTGAFLSKMAALRAYGLVSGRGYIQVTELGKRIVDPEQPNDPYEAVKEAITNIPLWRVFYENYTAKGVELPDADFWVDLRKITDLVPDDAKKVSNRVRKDYLDDIQYLKLIEKPKSEVSDMKERAQIDTSKANLRGIGEEPADLVKGLVKQGAYDIAKQFIDFLKAREAKKKQKLKPNP